MKYTFRCNTCGNEFDKDLKLTAVSRKVPKIKCTKCGGSTRKLINQVSVQYRGEGFTLRKDK